MALGRPYPRWRRSVLSEVGLPIYGVLRSSLAVRKSFENDADPLELIRDSSANASLATGVGYREQAGVKLL